MNMFGIIHREVELHVNNMLESQIDTRGVGSHKQSLRVQGKMEEEEEEVSNRAGLCVDQLKPLEGSMALLLVPPSGESSWDGVR